MSIRNKLLILLLTVSLVPLVMTLVLRQMSMHYTRGHIAKNIHTTLDQNAKNSLVQLLEHYEQILAREQLIMEGLIRSQVRETELRLDLEGEHLTKSLMQVCRELSLLGPKGMLRQQTLMVDGSYTCYPKERSPNASFRGKPWFDPVQQVSGLLRMGPYIDSVTQDLVVTIAALCVFCDQTGGDYYDFIEYKKEGGQKVGIALGDVTGHGIGAALLMATARGIFRYSAREFGENLSELFKHCSTQLAKDTDDDKFITLFYGILSNSDRSLIWASGGHDPVIWDHLSMVSGRRLGSLCSSTFI